MNNKKYEIIPNIYKEAYDSEFKKHIIYRIRSLVDIIVNGRIIVHIGDLGGYIESENNLSHDGNCWVFNDSEVYCNSIVSGNTLIYKSQIYDNVKICGNCKITESSIHGKSLISGNSDIYKSTVEDDANIYNALINDSVISGSAIIGTCTDNLVIIEHSTVSDISKIWGNNIVLVNVSIDNDAYIKCNDDIITITNSEWTIIAFRAIDNIIVKYNSLVWYYNDFIKNIFNLNSSKNIKLAIKYLESYFNIQYQ